MEKKIKNVSVTVQVPEKYYKQAQEIIEVFSQKVEGLTIEKMFSDILVASLADGYDRGQEFIASKKNIIKQPKQYSYANTKKVVDEYEMDLLSKKN